MRGFSLPALALFVSSLQASDARTEPDTPHFASSTHLQTLALQEAAAPTLAGTLVLRDAAVAQLLSYYNPETFLFGSNRTSLPFWTTGNAVDALSTYAAEAGDSAVATLLHTIVAPGAYDRYLCAGDCYHDDALWWIIAWTRAYTALGGADFLGAAESAFGKLVGPWRGWNTTCGGVNWSGKSPYRNSITNQLFLTAATNLHFAVSNDSMPITNFTYAGWAVTEADWIVAAAGEGLLPPSGQGAGLFLDGFTVDAKTCFQPSGAQWTYNQGVLLDGLVQVAQLSASLPGSVGAPQPLLDMGWAIAEAAFAFFAGGDPSGVMREINCGKNGRCGGQDGIQFKGSFLRHLALAAPGLAQFNTTRLAIAEAWIMTQVGSILSQSVSFPSNSTMLIGQLWQGPMDAVDFPWVSQSVGLDVLNAAVAVLRRREANAAGAAQA